MAGFSSLNANSHARAPASSGNLWMASVVPAFPGELSSRILDASDFHPTLPRLFEDIAQYVLSVKHPEQPLVDLPPATKKRKLEDTSGLPTAQTQTNGAASGALQNPRTVFSCKDVSFQIPMRKKLKLDICADSKDPSRHAIRLLNQSSYEVEYTLQTSQIEQAFCMTVPDKQARQSNFVLYPKAEEGVEPIVFALNETAPVDGVMEGAGALEEGDTYVSVVIRVLDDLLGYVGLQLVRPTEKEFASAIPQSHRKGEKGYHVRAHRGSKEGYLFLLPTGILFGFKKPLAFFPFSAIESISYTSVLQRTFNLVITTQKASAASGGRAGEEMETEDIEFSMLDQADFAGIDEYVKRHGLNDASMAAQRRAKAYNVNKVKQEDGAVQQNGGGEDEESELAKAEQALQDAEDEEEEDYEASGGESEGEGEDSEDDEDGEGEGEYDDDDAEGEEL